MQNINRQEIVQFYKKFYVPQEARLAVTGRLTPEIENEIKSQFSKWQQGAPLPQVSSNFQPPVKGSITKLQSPHKAQTEIRFIQPGIPRAHPDYLKLRLINEMLGGGFASRLNQRVRDDLGLTYSIYSALDAKKNAGGWIVSTFSKNPTAQQTVDEVFSVLKKFVDEGATEAELSASKNLVKAQLPRALETADQLAYNLIALDFYGVGVDYLINFNRTIDNISLTDINKALRQYLKPEQMQVLVYGQLNQ
jgi:zinc protease